MTENMRERAEDWNQESVNANETNRPDRLEPAHIWRDTGIDYLLVFNQSVMQLWRRSKTLARRGGDVKTLRVDPPLFLAIGMVSASTNVTHHPSDQSKMSVFARLLAADMPYVSICS
jgi:hypothetical protein